jgi:hypothetical protein
LEKGQRLCIYADEYYLNGIVGNTDPPLAILEPTATVENGKVNVNANRELEGDGEAPYASHCRSDALIWALYLKETEMEDKEVTDLWNNSLDSLLVFVSPTRTLPI